MVSIALVVLLGGAAPAFAMHVWWDRPDPTDPGGERMQIGQTDLTISGSALTGTIPGFLGSSWGLSSGLCWTGHGGVSWDDAQCQFALETTTRPATCTEQKRVRRRVKERKHVRRRVTVVRHHHKQRVWRWRWVTVRVWRWRTVSVRSTRDVAVTAQLEIAHRDGSALYYFYPDYQWEYGPPATVVASARSAPVDEHYPYQYGGIECTPSGMDVYEEGQNTEVSSQG